MYEGLLVMNKPAGMTSHDVVFKLRKLLKMKRIGHTGTLDPNVQGVLVCCLGQATKLVELLMEGQKGYRGEITLGIATETEDADGAVIEQVHLDHPFEVEVIDAAMASLEGDIIQIPPYYSAVKVAGKRLYEYARAGETVDRPQRQARIDQFTRLSPPVYHPDQGTQSWAFDVVCGKGTYVRTLAVDCGARLGVPSHMSHLVRYQTGGYNLAQAHTLDDVAAAVATGHVADIVIPLAQAVAFMPRYDLSPAEWTLVRNGQVISRQQWRQPLTEPTACFYQGQVRAIYGPHPTKAGLLKPLRMFQYEKE